MYELMSRVFFVPNIVLWRRKVIYFTSFSYRIDVENLLYLHYCMKSTSIAMVMRSSLDYSFWVWDYDSLHYGIMWLLILTYYYHTIYHFIEYTISLNILLSNYLNNQFTLVSIWLHFSNWINHRNKCNKIITIPSHKLNWIQFTRNINNI